MNKLHAERVLLVAMPQLGDVLLATPLLRSLRRAYPEATLDMLVYEGHDAVVDGNPDVDRVITVRERPKAKEFMTLVNSIFRHYDLAISNSTSDRKILYALLAAPKRVSIVPPPRWQDAWKRVFTHAWTVLDDESTHTVVQNLRLGDLLGIDRCYEVVAPRSQYAAQTLNRLLPFSWKGNNFAVLHLAPRWHYKRWTVSGWIKLAQYLIDKDLRVVLTGGTAKQELDYVRSAMLNMPERVINLAGKLRFSEVAQLIKASTIYIGPDTVVTHIAAATGVPTVALFGPTNPLKWAPWPRGYTKDKSPFAKVGTQRVNNVLLVQGTGDCVPCHQEGCERHKLSGSSCLDELSSQTVIRALDAFVNEGAPAFASCDTKIGLQEI